jgi:filamentous hemagglutinin family protein
MKLPRTKYDLREYSRKVIACCASASIMLTPAMSLSLPQGGVVSAGQATINDGIGRVDIHQQTDKAVIDWRGFDLNENETTQFHQPNANSLTVNRVNSNSPSIINGKISANGNVMVINSNGMLFGGKANVDVNGLIASTADASNADLMRNGKITLNKPGNPNAAIINQGYIKTKDGGSVGIIAPNISNQGIIEAKLGKVALASGDTATVDLTGDGLINAAVSDKVKSQLVENNGIISAQGGSIAITAAAGDHIVDSLINLDGVLDARSVGNKTGTIKVQADGVNAVKNNVTKDKGKKQGASNVYVSGIIDASGRGKGERGGKITVTGDNVALLNGAFIDASGDAGKSGTTLGKEKSAVRDGSAGGDIRIGGDYLGLGDTATAKNLYVDSGAYVLNDAISNGDAGRSIFWSDDTTQFYGNVFARALGGMGIDPATGSAIPSLTTDHRPLTTGDGGFVETSGHKHLDAGGYVDLTAANGNRGTYFLDPTNVTIFGNATSVFNSTNLAGYWNFDEGTGTTAGDTSGNGNNGTLTNGPTWSSTVAPTPQANTKSISLDGTDDFIVVPDANILDVADGSPLTLSIWVNSTRAGGAETIVAKGEYSVAWNYGMVLDGLDNLRARHNNGDNTSSNSIPLNSWQHLAVVYSGGVDNFYVNGVLVNSVADSGWSELSNAKALFFGTSFFNLTSTYGEFFQGLLDDPRLYNTNLSANDVAELYGSRFTVAGIQKMSQTADVSIQATNNITLDLGGDTLTMNNNRNLTLNAGNDILTASNGTIQTTTDGSTANTGNILLSAGRDINIAHDVNLVATGAGNNVDRGTVTLRANNQILYNGGGDITTNGGGIILNSDRDAVAGGFVTLNANTNLISNGGNVTLGGGASPSSGYALGLAGGLYGVNVSNATINSGAGNIILNGTGYSNAGTGYLNGVFIAGNALLQSTSGNITVNGIGGNGTQWNSGIQVNGASARITTATGAISLNGTGGNCTVGFCYGILLDGSSSVTSTGTGVGAGTITLQGQGGPTSGQATGIGVYGTTVSSVDGAINMTGTGGAAGGYGIFLYNNNNIVSTGYAPISLTGIATVGYADLSLSFHPTFNNVIGGTSNAGTITLNTDNTQSMSGTVALQTTGTVNIVPRTSTTSIGIAGGAGALNLYGALINSITAGQLNIGRADGTGTVTVGANTWNNNTKLFTGTTGINFTGAQNAGTKDFTVDGNINGFYNLDITAGSIGFTGNIGNSTALNNVTLNAVNAMTLPSINAATIFARTSGASGNITIGSGKTLTATGAGTPLTLAAGGYLVNNGGSTALSTPTGRWLVFAKDDNNTKGGLASNFVLYGCPYSTPCTYPPTGNGFLYANSPGSSGGGGGGSVTPVPTGPVIITPTNPVPAVVVNLPTAPAIPASPVVNTPSPAPTSPTVFTLLPATVEQISIDATPILTATAFQTSGVSQAFVNAMNDLTSEEDKQSPTPVSDTGDAQPQQQSIESEDRELSIWNGLLRFSPELVRKFGLDESYLD